jgi:hypothetical protein
MLAAFGSVFKSLFHQKKKKKGGVFGRCLGDESEAIANLIIKRGVRELCHPALSEDTGRRYSL